MSYWLLIYLKNQYSHMHILFYFSSDHITTTIITQISVKDICTQNFIRLFKKKNMWWSILFINYSGKRKV